MDGEFRTEFVREPSALKQHPALPMEERGYIYVAPNIKEKVKLQVQVLLDKHSQVLVVNKGKEKYLRNT